MERMSTLDAGFFFVEHKNVPMHLGSLMVFEGPVPAYRDIAGLFAAKLPEVPRGRRSCARCAARPPRRRPRGQSDVQSARRGRGAAGHRPRARRAAGPGRGFGGRPWVLTWHPGGPAPGWAWCSGRAGCSARPG